MIARRLLLGGALALPAIGARAQAAWPDRPVRFVVAFAPGGPADIIARLLAQALSEVWPHPVVVENRGGAGGNIAAQAVARAAPDGLTALLTTSAFAVNPSLSRNAGYRPQEFAVASVVAGTPNLFAVRGDGEVRTLRDLVEIGRRRPVNFGSAGIGSTPHLSAENLLKTIAKVQAEHIPFTGAGPAMTAALGGQIDMASVALPAAVQIVQSGRARGLAVTSARRVAALPDVPTVAEAGFDPIVDLTWCCVLFPAAVPEAVLEKVNADVNRLLATPAFQARLAATGFDPIGGSRAENSRFVADELQRWGEVVRGLNISLD
ncbi:tripartite tricarboxylate transporter substrate-binding protein [Falsiroseomonas ponticola]|uniref:tripartite tricarboxylate transporter substrate-binding protein n=1 Tax=Falsiroseomonas ponticola TaxID=2786951 RepID=UPI0019324D48|nr:tripartite tricarboxylate transporter substrate-binding protein [Roseomonas ponticola]